MNGAIDRQQEYFLENAALRHKVTELEKELQKRRDDEPRRFLEWRGIDVEYGGAKVCKDCSGSGVKSYASTSTWSGGAGGQQITSDICDKCWGSGDLNRPWLNLRLNSRILVAAGYNGCPEWARCKDRKCGECGT